MNKNKYLLLVSSIGVLILLIVAAFLDMGVEWNRIQGEAVAENGPIDVRIRQIVIPGLGMSDRCVSCHVGMDPSEQGIRGSGVLAAHKAVVHEPADFGCTLCHGGQGLATEQQDAHGDVRFWPEPMIPAQFSQAGCGTCHAHLGIPNYELLKQAQGTFERLDCYACHRVEERGGVLRPDGMGLEGPNLSNIALSGYDKDWYQKHLSNSEKVAFGPWHTSFARIEDANLRLLDTYLGTRMGAQKLIEAKSVFLYRGCMGCHKVSGTGGDEGPDLTRVGEKDPGRLAFTGVDGKHSLSNWFVTHFRSPSTLVAGSLMPPLLLTDEELDLLTFYTLSLRRRDLPGAYLPKDRLGVEKFGAREFSADGATVFGAICSGCHGYRGEGKRAPGQQTFPAIANAGFLELASDGFILETVVEGRPGRKMPAWGKKEGGLRRPEIEAAVAYLRQLGGVAPLPDPKAARWVSANAAEGERLFGAVCASCHGMKGEGKEGPALNNKILLKNATDTYLVETIGRGRSGTGMEGFRISSPSRQTLAQSEIEDIVTYIRSWEGAIK